MTKPPSPERDLVILLHESAALLRRRFEQEARPLELTLMQWRALALLEREGPQRQVAIGDALEASPMTISDLAERLQKAGLVTRGRDPEDSRAKMLDLTDAGRAKVESMHRVSTRVFAEVLDGLGMAEIDALRIGLRRIKENLGGK